MTVFHVIEQTFAFTLWIPWVMTICMWVYFTKDRGGRWGKQLILTFYGFYLLTMMGVIYILKSYYNVVRSNPFDTINTDWTYPCDVAFYLSSGVTYVFTYCFLWKIRLPASFWTILNMLIIAPSVLLVGTEYNQWYEVSWSIALGAVTTFCFLFFTWYHLTPELVTVILRVAPWKWMSTIDNHMRSNREYDELEMLFYS